MVKNGATIGFFNYKNNTSKKLDVQVVNGPHYDDSDLELLEKGKMVKLVSSDESGKETIFLFSRQAALNYFDEVVSLIKSGEGLSYNKQDHATVNDLDKINKVYKTND